ncbi:MAG: zinc ribbon domain-containing protein [Firmicutes bacterium]|nr:zinc ribbon domain-containing protein [Bacillota bacterium]
MPVFEYKCKTCGKKSERLVISSSEVVQCPYCGSRDLAKLFSTFAAHGVRGSAGGTGSRSCGTCSGGHCSTCH